MPCESEEQFITASHLRWLIVMFPSLSLSEIGWLVAHTLPE